MNARDVLAILDSLRMSPGEKARMEAEQKMKLGYLDAATTARLREQEGINKMALQQAKAIEEQQSGMLQNYLYQNNLDKGLPPDQAFVDASNTVNEYKSSPAYQAISSAHAATSGSENENLRNLGAQPFMSRIGETGAQATVAGNLATQAENLTREGKAGEAGLEGLAATRAEDVARGKIANYQGENASLATPWLSALVGKRSTAESADLSNKINASSAAAPFVAPAAEAETRLKGMQGQFDIKKLNTQDPILAGRAQDANNQRAISTANTIVENPALNPDLKQPQALPGFGITPEQMKSLDELNKYIKLRGAPAAQPVDTSSTSTNQNFRPTGKIKLATP